MDMIIQSIFKIEKLLSRVLKKENKFSLVRLGDGEFTIMRYPKYTSIELFRDRFERWFFINKISYQELFNIRNSIVSAMQTANILGVPSVQEQRTYLKWNNFNKIINELITMETKIFFYNYDITKLNYKKLLWGTRHIVTISCHDLRKQISKTFNIKEVTLLQCPVERFNYRDNHWKEKQTQENHFLEYYLSILSNIRKLTEKGTLFLIGAGGLGKIYCNEVKNNGGIAIDIGAIFDGWAGKDSRPYLKNMEKL